MERGSKKKQRVFVGGIRKKLYQILPFGDEHGIIDNLIANNLFCMFCDSGDISWFIDCDKKEVIKYIIKIINDLNDLELGWVIKIINKRKEKHKRYPCNDHNNSIMVVFSRVDFSLDLEEIIKRLKELEDEFIVEEIIK